jgi:O-methyltransferase
MKKALRRIVYSVPGTQRFWIRLNKALGRAHPPAFSGWGMETTSWPPWHDGGGDRLAREFAGVNGEILARVAAGTFKLSQFNDVQDKGRQLQELMWRHYVVFWSARYAAAATRSPVKNLVECGVCDGLTAYFAVRAVHAAGADTPFRAFLYDAWEGMKSEHLLDSEKDVAGNYSYLSLENTKQNLAAFQRDLEFIKGFIPESFAAGIPPEIAWLHIDLNSSLPTTAALNALFANISPGGVVLFDDYGGYHETRVAVDTFFADKRGLLLPMPTGQAIFFKH